VSVFRALSRFGRSISHKTTRVKKGVRAMIEEAVRTMIYKVRIKKKYPFKQMNPGETLKLNDVDVRDAQKAAYYYRSQCKRPIEVLITKQADGYYCHRVA
jgi:hypothetical protein